MDRPPGPRVADTSCLYALFDTRDPHHEAAVAEVAAGGPLVIPAEVLVETLGLITSRAGRPQARAARTFLEALPHAEFSHPTDLHEVLLVAKTERLSVVDAAVVWHCRRLPARAATFDGRLRNLAAAKT